MGAQLSLAIQLACIAAQHSMSENGRPIQNTQPDLQALKCETPAAVYHKVER